MDKKILAICDSEADYAYRMMEVLKTRRDLHFDIHVFSGIENLLDYGRKSGAGAIECLLVGESLYSDEVRELAIPHVFILNEGGPADSSAGREDDRPCHINKYRPADRIVNDILAYCAEQRIITPRRAVASGTAAKIIGIYSPIARCLQTTFSMTLGQILAKKQKTLYLNYESFSGFGQLTGRSFRADISDMMYLFECVKEKFIYKLGAITEQIGGLDFIPPAAIYPDLRNIPGRQWTKLLGELRDRSDYRYIILDLSDYVDGLLQILRECDWIYTITKGDVFAQAKMEQYERLLQELDYGDVAAMTQKLNLPIFKNIPLRYDEMSYSELAAYIRERLLDDLCK